VRRIKAAAYFLTSPNTEARIEEVGTTQKKKPGLDRRKRRRRRRIKLIDLID